jgi:hypothetical protein
MKTTLRAEPCGLMFANGRFRNGINRHSSIGNRHVTIHPLPRGGTEQAKIGFRPDLTRNTLLGKIQIYVLPQVPRAQS